MWEIWNRGFISWLFNFRRCQCSFYTGQWLWKCNNCGGKCQ